jgi:hypothetical protein
MSAFGNWRSFEASTGAEFWGRNPPNIPHANKSVEINNFSEKGVRGEKRHNHR